MSYNPYDAPLEDAQISLRKAEQQRGTLQTALDAHRRFPLARKQSDHRQLADELMELRARIDSAHAKETSEAAHEQELARLAHVPLTSLLRSHLPLFGKPLPPEKVTSRAALAACKERLVAVRRTKSAAQDAAKLTEGKARTLSSEINQHLRFDANKEEGRLQAAVNEVERLSAKIGHLRAHKEEIDREIEPQVRELARCEQARLNLESDIRQAESLDRKLSSAQNSYERAMLHEECGRLFGESKPRKVRDARQRELAGVLRTKEKLEERIQTIVKRATREISLIIIDGNNLCYESSRFIGTQALRALVPELTARYEVLVVFDASARAMLRMNDEDIGAQFAGAKVHVAASGQRADEMLLDVAEGSTSYVLSNDRFRDFPEKSAVRAGRLIRHEIVNGQVLVHDLNVRAQLRQPVPS